MENNMVLLWRDVLVTFVLWVSARMVSGREKFSIKCVGKPTNSHLWRLNQNPPSYLFGTIHYPWDILWNNPDHIHKNVKYAFKKSQSIYTELDFSNVTTLNALQKCRFLPGNLTLRNFLPRSLIIRLRRHLAYVRRSFESWLPKDFSSAYPRALTADYLYSLITQNWKRKRPVWIVVLIMLELTPASVKRQQKDILDLFLTKVAKKRGNDIGGLETAADQCDPFNKINNREAVFLLNYTLHLQELIRSGKMKPKHENEQDKILKVYLCGNLKNGIVGGSNRLLVNKDAEHHVSQDQVKKIIEIEEYLLNELVYKRNRKMAKRIDGLLKMNKTTSFFFAVGTGHLSGKSSVVELLQKKGYKIDHVKPNDLLSGQRRWERRRDRRRAERAERERLRNLKERMEWERQNKMVFFTQPNNFGVTDRRQTTVNNDMITSQPEIKSHTQQEKPVVSKVANKGPNFVYYYTNSQARQIGESSMLIICWCLIFFTRQVVT